MGGGEEAYCTPPSGALSSIIWEGLAVCACITHNGILVTVMSPEGAWPFLASILMLNRLTPLLTAGMILSCSAQGQREQLLPMVVSKCNHSRALHTRMRAWAPLDLPWSICLRHFIWPPNTVLSEHLTIFSAFTLTIPQGGATLPIVQVGGERGEIEIQRLDHLPEVTQGVSGRARN